MSNEFQVGDWVVFDLRVGQITEPGDWQEFSDGTISTSGRLIDRFRPLTLRNKAITETFDYWYRELGKIDGEQGFNYPRISQHFWALALEAIDSEDASVANQKARDFVDAARHYEPEIPGREVVPTENRVLTGGGALTTRDPTDLCEAKRLEKTRCPLGYARIANFGAKKTGKQKP